ncbi:MAG: transposase [Myxococcales bacterium]|nr:transposase [Myxococcales bacterium]
MFEGLDLLGFEARYAALGEHAHPPRMLLKLWLFGAMEGVYSDGEIARRVRWDLRFRYLAGGLDPGFRTVNRFRGRHREDFAEVFRQTVRASGLAKLGRVAVDGSKMRVNTSRHKATSHGRMQEAVEADRGIESLAVQPLRTQGDEHPAHRKAEQPEGDRQECGVVVLDYREEARERDLAEQRRPGDRSDREVVPPRHRSGHSTSERVAR